MKPAILWKFIATLLVLGWSLAYLFPLTDTPFTEYALKSVEVDADGFAALVQEAEQLAVARNITETRALRELATERTIDLQETFFPSIRLSSRNLERRNEALVRVLFSRSRASLRRGLDLVGGTSVTYSIGKDLTETGDVELQLRDAVKIMRERVDGLGVSEPVIRPVPPNRLEVQLPGINPEQASELQKAARLDFRKAWRGNRPPPGSRPGTLEILPTQPWDPNSPQAAYEVMVLEREERDGSISQELHYIKKEPEFRGQVANAGVTLENGRWSIAVEFNEKGRKAFADLTTEMHETDQRFNQPGSTQTAIVLDGKLASVLGLNESSGPITGGRASISGNFTQIEAMQLANVLNNPLEFELEVADLSTVSPTLAADAQKASIQAGLLGAALVIAFMIAFYLSAGVVAVVSVLLNVVIILGMLAALGATMTLPGVAAIVLTIGMAVDANILIFERIREELRAGKSLASALQMGYDKAFSTIVDANVTTFITALILILMGSGPVKGFGVTLAIGIGASVFGALVITRAFLELLVSRGWVQTLIPKRFEKPLAFTAMKFRWPAFAVSWLIVLLGIGTLLVRGSDVLGIDFTGGAEVMFSFDESHSAALTPSAIEALAEREGLGEVQAYRRGSIGGGAERLVVQIDAAEGRDTAVIEALQAAFPEAQLTVVGENVIGASVSEGIRWNALFSVLLALVGILLYVAFRFEIGFGAGALVATIHDVLMTIGIFVLLGGQFTAPMIAAILMIVGYSINDTIVVFDRIREELELRPDMDLLQIVNFAISRTLSRTILTSATTLLAAVALFIFSTGVIQDYALVFIIGIVTGTFSSIFIATPIFFAWHKGSRQHVEEREMARPVYEWEVGGNRPKDA